MTHTSRSLVALMVLCGMTVCKAAIVAPLRLVLQTSRHEPGDLEVGGSLQVVPQGQTRLVSYASLLSLPRETYIVRDHPHFGKMVQVSGVSLAKLPAWLRAQDGAMMTIAICSDKYAAHYPASYVSAHHPLLIPRVNGLSRGHWPLGVDRLPMGLYLVSHPSFTSSFQILSHQDELQGPWGFVRLDLRREQEVYAPIEPQGAANDPIVLKGYLIARQNCFRCHSRSGEGGQKSSLLWRNLAHRAVANPPRFDGYVRTPRALNPNSQMAASPQYDEATLGALRHYFSIFTEAAK